MATVAIGNIVTRRERLLLFPLVFVKDAQDCLGPPGDGFSAPVRRSSTREAAPAASLATSGRTRGSFEVPVSRSGIAIDTRPSAAGRTPR